MTFASRHTGICALLFLALFFGSADNATAQRIRPEVADSGTFAVGYKYIYRLDSTRAWIPFPAREGETPTGKERRPIRVGIWYPAVERHAERMAYRNYVTPEAPDSYFGRLNEVMARYDLWSYNEMFDEDSTVLERFLEAKTGSVLEAQPARGPFPVVLYSAGWYSQSPDNSVLFEYLASHGYVVVTVPQLGPGVVEFDFKVTPERIHDQIADLAFALDVVSHEPFADAERVATAGFSIGGIVALLLQLRDERVDAVMGLDGSFVREDWVELTLTAPEFAADNGLAPILAFHRYHEKQREGFSTAVLDSLPRADRYLVAVQTATHGEFSNEPSIFAGLGIEWLRADWNTLDQALTAHEAIMVSTRAFLDDVFDPQFDGEKWIAQLSSLKPRLEKLLVVNRMPPASE